MIRVDFSNLDIPRLDKRIRLSSLLLFRQSLCIKMWVGCEKRNAGDSTGGASKFIPSMEQLGLFRSGSPPEMMGCACVHSYFLTS